MRFCRIRCFAVSVQVLKSLLLCSSFLSLFRYGPASSGRFGHKQKSSRAQLPSLAEKLPDHGSSDEKSEFLSLPVRSPGDNASRVSGGDHTSVRGWERRHTVPEHELNITMSPPAAASLPSPSEVAFNDMVPKTVAALVPLIEEFYRPVRSFVQICARAWLVTDWLCNVFLSPCVFQEL